MSDKSESKLSDLNKKRDSLSVRVARTVLAGCISLGILLLVVSLTAYIFELSRRQISTAFNLSVSAKEIVNRYVDAEKYAKQVMAVYYGMSKKERSQVGTDEYYESFAEIERDPGYRTLKAILSDFRNTQTADYIYMAVYDRRTQALVYVVDTDVNEKTYCPPGHWETVPEREVNSFLEWDGTGLLYNFGDTEKYGYIFTSGVPVSRLIGDGKAFILSDIRTDTLSRKSFWFVLNYTVILILAMALLSVIIVRRMGRTIVTPIKKIETAAKSYVEDKKEHNDNREHFTSLGIDSGDEIESLCRTMGGMEADIDAYEKNLADITAEKARVTGELKLASRIQGDMLPCIFPAFPERDDFDVYATMEPAKEVGGDFYDFFLLDQDRLALVIADVSGKGVPAALFMMVTKSMLKTALMAGVGVAKALTNVNNQICGREHEGMFVTVWAGILDLKTGVLTASNAGHEYPMIRRPGGQFEIYKDKHSFVLGGLAGLNYKEYQIELEQGSKLFLYTDGVTEATDSGKELFGMDRLTESLNKADDSTPQSIISSVRKDIDDFVGEAEQFDDITMLCLDYGPHGGPEGSDGRNGVEVLLDVTKPAEIASVTEVTDLIDAELEKLECPMKAQVQLNIAIDELFSNIAKYAYDTEDGDAQVLMTYCEPRGEVTITFVDSGKPYDPTAQDDPDVTLSAEERGIGGLGILLVKKSMDGMRYENKDGKNYMSIIKKIK